MRTVILRVMASSTVVAGLLSGAALPAGMAVTAQASTGTPAALAGRISTARNLHGFRLTYQQANPDGSVTALLQRGRTSVVYLGGAGAQISVSATAAKVVTARVHGKTRRLLRQGLQVGATSSGAPPTGASPVFGAAGRGEMYRTASSVSR